MTASKCPFPQYLEVLLTKTHVGHFRACTLLASIGEFGLVPYPKTVSLRVGCILAKFHGFIIKVNNSHVFGR